MIKIKKIIPGGMGLSTNDDGKKIFLWNALPGEIIAEYQIIKNKSHYQEAIATKIHQASNFRVEPRDDCFLATSPWQIIDYQYELQLKSDLVAEIFQEHHINITPPTVFTDSNDYFYRNKMEYALYYDLTESKIKLAFHKRGSHRKTPITSSSIERPELFQKAIDIINELNNNHEEARKYQSLLLRCNQKGEVSGGLFENHQPHPLFKSLKDTILGQDYYYSPNGFFQINLPVYELALKEIKKHINTENVLDLYAGVGTIGLSVAGDHQLTLVECDKSAYEELCKNSNNVNYTMSKKQMINTTEDTFENKNTKPNTYNHQYQISRKNGQNNKVLTYLSKSEDMLDFIQPNQTVILDPPRAGCDQKLINHLNEVKPKMIIYLSCNPATQARDISILLKNYHIETIKTFNFFPHTPHIENLVILSL